MRKFLIGLVVLIAAIAAVVVVGPSFVDWNAYKGQLAAQVEAATGRRLTIDGDLSLSILPTPRFSASGVRLGNVEGAAGPDMIRLDTARVRIAIAPLFQGLLEVETVELINPRIELERLADGTTNWSFAPTASPVGDPAGGGGNGFSMPEIKFNDIRIRNGTLVYRDQSSGLVERIENINASIAAGSFQGPFRAEGDFRARDLPLQMRLAVGRLLEERAVPVSLVVGVGDEVNTAEFSGVLSGFPGGSRLNGSLMVRSENTAALLAAFPGLPAGVAGQPATIEGELTASSAGISLNGVSLRLARASATGAVQFTFGTPSRLDIVLNIGQVDIDQLLASPDDPEPAATGNQSGGTAPAELPRAFAPGRSGSGSFALPQGLDASIEAKIDAMVLNGGILRQVRVAADLSGGELTLNQASAQLPGGSDISLFGLVVPIDGDPVFDGQLEANSDNFRALLSWLNVDVGGIPAGRLRKFELAAKVKATPDELTMSGIDMQLDLSNVRGGVAIALRRRPGFGIGLSIDRINLDAYLPSVESTPQPTADAADEGAPAENQGADEVPPPALAPLAFLDRFDAILQLRVGSLTYQGTPVSGLEFDGTLQGGVLDLRNAAVADFAGAGLSASGRIAGLGERPSADLAVAIDAGDTSRLMAALGRPLPFRLRAAKVEANVTGDLDALNVSARLLALDGEVKVEGNIAALDKSPRFQITVDAAHPSFNALIAALGNYPKTAGDPGRLAFTGKISGDFASAEVDMTARLGEGSFTLKGSLADLATGASGDLALQLRHPSLTTLARTFRPDYRPALADLGEFRLSTDLNFDPVSAKMTSVSGAVGPIALQGEADLAFAPDERPRLTASLATSEIIVEWFLAPVAAAAGLLDGEPPTSGDAAQSDADAAVPTRNNGRWSRQPFDLSFLNNIDAELALSAPALSLAGYDVGSPDILIQLDEGKLQLRRFAGALFGGTISVTGDVLAADPPEINLIMSVAGADAPQMIAASRAGKSNESRNAVSGVLELLFPVAALDLSSGTLGTDMAISSSGRSEFELISNLAGSGEVSFTDAVIDGTDLCAISDQLGNLQGLDGFLGLIAAGDGGQTKINDFIGRFDIARGIATLPRQSIRSECAVVAFGGTIDLPRWRIETRADVTFPKHTDFPGIIVEEKGSLNAPNARLANVNAIQQYLITKAAGNALRELLPAQTAPIPEPAVIEPAAPAPAPAPEPEQAANPELPAAEEIPQQAQPAEELPLIKPDPFKNLLDALTR